MQECVSNDAQSQEACHEFLNLRMLPGETMRNFGHRAMRIAACLPDCPGEEQVKPQMIIGLQLKLRKAALIAQYLPFDAMISTIEQIISSDQAVTSGGRPFALGGRLNLYTAFNRPPIANGLPRDVTA